MRIGLDIDSVLLDTMPAYLNIFNNTNGTKYQKKDITNFDFRDILHIDKATMYKYFESIYWKKVKLCDPYCVEVINDWKRKGYFVDLITASSNSTISDKCERLKALNVNFDCVHIVGVTSDKKLFAKEYDLIVDDSPMQLESILNAGGNPICFDQPWNQGWDGARAFSFKHIDSIIRKGY